MSSYQIDQNTRGFSFGYDGPLDMRMNKDATTVTAAEIVNHWDSTILADVLYNYGDETKSRQIAREIIAARPLNTTRELFDVIARITSFKHRMKTMARCFQALRIVVNDEMGVLESALNGMADFVKPGGRLVVLSYHSLEDGRVKRLIKSGSSSESSDQVIEPTGNMETSYLSMMGLNQRQASSNPWLAITKRAATPSDEEIKRNRRSRSAKLRIAERLHDEGPDDTGNVRETSKSYPRVGAKQLKKLRMKENPENVSD